MNKPSELTLRGVQVAVEWKHLKMVEDKRGNNIEVFLPIPPPFMFGYIDASEIRQNILVESDATGEVLTLSPEELNHIGVPLEDVQTIININVLQERLKAEGFEADAETIRGEGEKLGAKYYNLKDSVKNLLNDAWEIEVEDAIAEVSPSDDNEPLTKGALREIMGEQEKRRSHPWLFKQPKDMTDEEFKLYDKALRDSALSGRKIDGIKQPSYEKEEEEAKSARIQQLTEGDEGKEKGEETDEKGLFDLSKDTTIPVADMSDKHHDEHWAKQKDEATRRE